MSCSRPLAMGFGLVEPGRPLLVTGSAQKEGPPVRALADLELVSVLLVPGPPKPPSDPPPRLFPRRNRPQAEHPALSVGCRGGDKAGTASEVQRCAG